MKEVIERVKAELKQQYEPLYQKVKDEGKSQVLYYEREMAKIEKRYKDELTLIEIRLKSKEEALFDYMNKYKDKCLECESYIGISEHRLDQYNELMSKKKELEVQRKELYEQME